MEASRSIRPRLRAGPLLPRSGASRAAAQLAGVLACLLLGVAVARGSKREVVLAGLVAALFLTILVLELGFDSVVIWAVATVAAYPFLRIPHDHPYATFDRLWIGAMIGLLLIGRRDAVRNSRATRLVLVALVWLALAYLVRAVTTIQPLQQTVTALDGVILPVVLFAVTARLATTRWHAERVTFALMLAGLLLALIGIVERATGLELASLTAGAVRYDQTVDLVRVSGPYGVPEPYALALLSCFAATLYWLQARRAYWIGGTIAVLELAAIGLTLFRAAWGAAVIIAIVAFGLRARRLGRLAGVVLVTAAVLFIGYTQLKQSTSFGSRVSNVQTVYTRYAIYQEAWELFKQNPVMGVGVNQYTTAVAALPNVNVRGANAVPYAHSSYLNQLAEQGIWGFLPFLALQAAVIVLLRRFRRLAQGVDAVLVACVIGAAIGYVIMSATLTMLPYGPSNAFFVVLVGLVAGRLDRLESERAAASRA